MMDLLTSMVFMMLILTMAVLIVIASMTVVSLLMVVLAMLVLMVVIPYPLSSVARFPYPYTPNCTGLQDSLFSVVVLHYQGILFRVSYCSLCPFS